MPSIEAHTYWLALNAKILVAIDLPHYAERLSNGIRNTDPMQRTEGGRDPVQSLGSARDSSADLQCALGQGGSTEGESER